MGELYGNVEVCTCTCRKGEIHDGVKCEANSRNIARTVSLHGLRRLGVRDGSAFRRFVWITILLGGTVLFFYQAVTSIVHFVRSEQPTTVHRLTDLQEFPAITICNINPIRLSEVYNRGWYEEVFKSSKLSTHNTRQTFYMNVSSREVFTTSAHRLDDMVLKCFWRGEPCAPDSFSTSVTEEGICFTFQPEPSSAESSGRLEMLINLETYEYIPQITDQIGITVKSHDAQAHPIFCHDYITVPPGVKASLDISGSLVRRGKGKQCDAAPYHHGTCLAQCVSAIARAECGCLPFWEAEQNHIKGGGRRLTFCDMRTYFRCVTALKGSLSHKGGYCQCKRPCEEAVYELRLKMLDFSPWANVIADVDKEHLKKKLTHGKNIQDKLNTVVYQRDQRLILTVARSLEDLVLHFNKLRRKTTEASEMLQQLVGKLEPRIKFHLRIAIGGLRKTLENSFIRGWKEVWEEQIRHVTMGYHEVLIQYQKTIERLRKISKTDEATRRGIYINLDLVLSTKMEMAIKALDNITKIHYAFLKADPIYNTIITPERRYDSTLIPGQILMQNKDKQTECYNSISTNLAGFIKQIMALQKELKLTYETNNFNSTLFSIIQQTLSEQSENIIHYTRLFNDRVVVKTIETVEHNAEHFKRVNHSLIVTYKDTLRRASNLEAIVGIEYRDLYVQIITFTRLAQDYLNRQDVLKSSVAAIATSFNMENALLNIHSLIAQMEATFLELQDGLNKIKRLVQSIWNEILTDSSLETFYYKVYSDVNDMVRHPMKKTFYESIFLHPKLLDLTLGETKHLRPEDYFPLLNADATIIPHDTKMTEIEQSFAEIKMMVDVKNVTQNARLLLRAYSRLQKYLVDFQNSLNVDSSFISDNIIQLDIKMRQVRYPNTVIITRYSAVSLLGDIGGLLALLLGASVMTVFELLDVLVVRLFYRKKKIKHSKCEPPLRDQGSVKVLHTCHAVSEDEDADSTDFGHTTRKEYSYPVNHIDQTSHTEV